MLRWLVFVVGAILLGSCATTPSPTLGPVPVRVVSFAMEWGLHLTGANGPSEAQPGLFLGSDELFEGPYRETMERLWPEFLAQISQGGNPIEGPGVVSEGSPYWEATEGPVGRMSALFPPPRGRGYVWPQGLRFAADPQKWTKLAEAFPGEALVLVEYTGFSEDVGEENSFGPPMFRLGLRAKIQVLGPDGKSIDVRTILGKSRDSAPRRGGRLDRNVFSELFSQAQADVVRVWLKSGPLRRD